MRRDPLSGKAGKSFEISAPLEPARISYLSALDLVLSFSHNYKAEAYKGPYPLNSEIQHQDGHSARWALKTDSQLPLSTIG